MFLISPQDSSIPRMTEEADLGCHESVSCKFHDSPIGMELSLLNKDSFLVECVQSFCDSILENCSSFEALKTVISRNQRVYFVILLTDQNIHFSWDLTFCMT